MTTLKTATTHVLLVFFFRRELCKYHEIKTTRSKGLRQLNSPLTSLQGTGEKASL